MSKFQTAVRYTRRLDAQVTSVGESDRAAAIAQLPPAMAKQSPLGVILTTFETTFHFALRAPLFRVGVILVGAFLVNAGLVLSVLVVAMFVSPGGIGMEKLFGPVFGFFALVLIFLGSAIVYLGIHAKASPPTP